MKHVFAVGLVIFPLLFIGCQSKKFRVTGTTEGIKNNDTLFVSTDMIEGTPSDTLIVKDGGFIYEGETDSTRLCMIYCKNRPDINIPFFIEPGNINIHMKADVGKSRVSGTLINDEWQLLTDTVNMYGKQINNIVTQAFDNGSSSEQQDAAMVEIKKLEKQLNKSIIRTAERNIQNELGYFIINYYDDEVISNEERLILIKKLPEVMRNRPRIKQMESVLLERSNMKLPDFSMQDLEGNSVSVLSEISKHKITIIDFWATWCAPCMQEMPKLKDTFTRLKDKGLGIIGISLDTNAKAWKNTITKLQLDWTHLSELNGWENSAVKMFNINAIPFTLVVDNNGKVLQAGLRGEELSEFVQQRLDE